MKKGSCLLLVLVFVFLALLQAPQVLYGQEVVTLKMADSFPIGHISHEAALYFIKRVGEILRLIGSSQQIEDILLSADWNPRLNECWFSSVQEVIEQGKKHRFTSMGFKNLFKPKGISISMNLAIRLREDINTGKRSEAQG